MDRDLRRWIELLKKEGELAEINAKVDWNLEIGGIVQEAQRRAGPAVLFTNIRDYEKTLCTKLFSGSLGSYSRVALMMGLPKETPPKELIRVFMERMRNPISSRIVDDGPVKKNIFMDEEVDLFKFPTPKWHDLDGGRYIGTGGGVVTKDPETGISNVGLYRQMIHNKNQTGISIVHGQHIWLHWRKYKQLGQESMPMATVIGWDPVLPMIACASVPYSISEYDAMGALIEEPVRLVKCETNDLEVPASSEIVLEGEVSFDPATFTLEGPFGEYTGYYCSLPGPRPTFTVKCITCRNDPIQQGILEGKPIGEDHIMEFINHSATLWEELNNKMWGVTGVNVHPSTAWANVFVQVDNSYIGQVHQVASTIWSLGISNMLGKNIMVVDQDIDISDLNDLAWAFAYRVDPKKDIIPYPGWVSPLDPVVHPKDRVGKGGSVQKGTRLLIDATKDILNPKSEQWFGQKFAPLAVCSEETISKVRKRWEEYGI